MSLFDLMAETEKEQSKKSKNEAPKKVNPELKKENAPIPKTPKAKVAHKARSIPSGALFTLTFISLKTSKEKLIATDNLLGNLIVTMYRTLKSTDYAIITDDKGNIVREYRHTGKELPERIFDGSAGKH